MKLLPLFALFLNGLSWGSAKEEILPEISSLGVPRSLVNKWTTRYDGHDFTIEFFMDRRDRHFTFSMTPCKTPPDPAKSPALVPNLCHFMLEREPALHAIGTLSYTDPATGNTLYLIP